MYTFGSKAEEKGFETPQDPPSEAALSRGPASAQRGPSRRQVVAGLMAAAVAAPGGTATASAPGGGETKGRRHKTLPSTVDGSLRDLDPKNVYDAYRARGLDRWGDRELAQGVAGIVSKPGKTWTSFTLHAPLEILARTGLLPWVAPPDRELARMQMVASGAVYEAGVVALPEPRALAPFPDPEAARRQLADVFRSGDEDGLEATVLAMARQFGSAELVRSLTPALLPSLTSASHAHIGLWLLLRHGAEGDPGDASILRAAARRLAADPKGRLGSFGGMDLRGEGPLRKTPAQLEKEVLARLVDPPRGEARRRGIRPLMEAGEGTGNADRFFGDLVRRELTGGQMAAVFRACLRASAHSMLQDDPSRAKFGWSHCLTLPQAACGLSNLGVDPKLGMATTLVWLTAYRSILSRRTLDFGYRPKPLGSDRPSLREALHSGTAVAASRFWHADPAERPEMFRILASEASIRNDQHLAKYTRACFDMCGFDPEHWRLYLASAAKLCALWILETPRGR
ncbi:MAG: hypothetical protein AAGD06_22645, partial [Acidobacteriota bacterium]